MSIQSEIITEIKKYDRIIIHRHQRPDPDALGSQVGLAEILRESFPTKEIYQVGETVLGDKLIKIDHHPNDEPYGDLVWVNTDASSCSEMIAEFALLFPDELKINAQAARLLYAGIVGDTGRFLYPATTSRTLEIAAILMSYPFDASALNREIEQMPMKVAKLSGYIYQNIEVDEHGAGKVILSQEILSKYAIDDSETAAIVSLPGVIDEVLAWGIFVQQPEGYYRVRLRSKGPVINELAKRHHGGGHPLASGANAKDLTEVAEIYQEIQEMCRAFNK